MLLRVEYVAVCSSLNDSLIKDILKAVTFDENEETLRSQIKILEEEVLRFKVGVALHQWCRGGGPNPIDFPPATQSRCRTTIPAGARAHARSYICSWSAATTVGRHGAGTDAQRTHELVGPTTQRGW